MTKKKELGPIEIHPYGEFIPQNVNSIIIGSFPIGKFTNPLRRNKINLDKEIDFFYGGIKNKLWDLIGSCYQQDLSSVDSIKKMLIEKKLGLGDVIYSCRRINGSALDKDLKEIQWNTSLIKKIKANNITRILFTSKTVKKWFESHISDLEGFEIETLISPSPAALIWLSTTAECKSWLTTNPEKKTTDFRLYKYQQVFLII